MLDTLLQEAHSRLINNEAVRTRLIYSNKNKVIRIKVIDTPIRVKITASLMVAVRDTNESFVKSLFPDYSKRFDDLNERNDYALIIRCISFMRIRMELRRDLMDAAFANPQETLRLLELEHDARKF
jgi:hypothetical protein